MYVGMYIHIYLFVHLCPHLLIYCWPLAFSTRHGSKGAGSGNCMFSAFYMDLHSTISSFHIFYFTWRGGKFQSHSDLNLSIKTHFQGHLREIWKFGCITRTSVPCSGEETKDTTAFSFCIFVFADGVLVLIKEAAKAIILSNIRTNRLRKWRAISMFLSQPTGSGIWIRCTDINVESLIFPSKRNASR